MQPDVVPVVVVDHAPFTEFATEAYTLSPDLQISVPKSKQHGSAGSGGLDTQPTVGNHVVHTDFSVNQWSFSTLCLPLVRYRPRCSMA